MSGTHTLSRVGRWFGPATFLAMLLCMLMATGLGATEQAQRQLDAWKKEVAETEKTLIRADLSATRIAQLRDRLEKIRADAFTVIEGLRPELQNFQKRLDQLKPAEGQEGEEPEAIVKERADVTERVTQLQAIIKQLELTALTASQLSGRAAEMQRNRFLQRIFEPGPSVLNPEMWIEGLKHSTALYERLQFIIKNWFKSTSETQTVVGWLARLGLLFVAWLIVWPGRKRLLRLVGPNLDDPDPSKLERLWRAVCIPVVNVLTVLLTFYLLAAIAVQFRAGESLRIGQIAEIAVGAIIVFAFLSSLIRGVLAPAMPAWRLPAMSDQLAPQLSSFLVLIVAVFAIGVFMTELASVLFLPVQFTVMQSAIESITVVLLLMAALVTAVRGTQAEAAAGEVVAAPAPALTEGLFSWISRIRAVIWIILAASLIALLLGYISLASFLSIQIISTGTILVSVYLLHHLADEALTSGLERGQLLGDFLRRTFSMSDRAIERLGITLSTVVDILLVLIALPLVVLQWTVTWIDLKSWLSIAFFGFRIGDVTISPSKILLAIVVLLVGLVLTRLIVQWLDTRLLRRTRFDRGIRDSIKTGANYSGIIIAVILAATYAGIDFTNLAIVAGALGVGIGFGLQSIVNNFVSGLILLAERPIRVGDWIVVGAEQGTVREINVRATEIETFDRSTVIIPNSTLITGTVKNWTHSDKMGRLSIPVGVTYACDPEQVQTLLLECAADHTMVLRAPEPYVYFKDFGPSSLDFELRCYIIDVDNLLTVSSDLRYAIFKKLKEAGIEIPFPQRDVNFKDMDRLEQALASLPGGTTPQKG